MSDNESVFLAPGILNFVRSLEIEIYFTPAQKYELNGQAERFHTTLIEMKNLGPTELVNIAIDRYNKSYNS